ncbi:MAG: hypothetical protein OEM02_04065 [Desulfobulbaceae bacterium]|nr:hypothetical protein [Desulfobulbaceae bacterium]
MDGFIWIVLVVGFIVPPPAGEFTHKNPVSDFVAGSLLPICIDKSFQPLKRMVVHLFHVKGNFLIISNG